LKVEVLEGFLIFLGGEVLVDADGVVEAVLVPPV
jgi:hypothetical protein